MREKKFIVIDTETANDISFPLPYDIGWIVSNRKGEILEQYSFVVYEIYCKEKELMKSAYYAEKIPQYEQEIKEGKRIIKSFWTIRKIFLDCIERNNISDIYAYNMNFDKRALNNDTKYICKPWFYYFFPKGMNYKCIWRAACDLLMARASFINWAEIHGFESPSGNLYTNAEVCYKYLTNQLDFEESHTGLEDVLIENTILNWCFRQKKKMNTEPNSACWQTVQKKRKEMRNRQTI